MLLHPDAFLEIANDRDNERRLTRTTLARKYAVLELPPELSLKLATLFGSPLERTHNYFDARLMEAVQAGRVDVLVTDDADLHRRARVAGLGDRVLSSSDALEMARDLHEPVPTPPPYAIPTTCAKLDRGDPLFDELRQEYDGFDGWLDNAVRQRRRAWVVPAVDDSYAALAIIKDETPGEHGLQGKLLKVCTFKVSEDHGGYRYGELLLKAILDFATVNGYERVFLEAHPDKEHLFLFLEQFGFHRLAVLKNGVDPVYAKVLHPTGREAEGLSNLDFHIEFGPPALRSAGVPSYIVPIRPEFHSGLFPDAERQLALTPPRAPHANAIRKAYLCRSKTRTLEAGDLIYFYLSGASELTVMGVVEDVAALSDAADIVKAAGKRTLYAYSDIEGMVGRGGEVLVIGFRQARILEPRIELKELKEAGVLKGHPQTVTRLSEEGAT